ncbi:hypothetical protein VP01_685g1 [Puccinia sorghi]|uniref:Uncharacterized protein n=1 Tax=Puccinia sorghi TaxID=27349 RepID=A0A0L6UEC0_9BASI|nr:hypothetical protein VP01_685g1 [Puccinia sorghi]
MALVTSSRTLYKYGSVSSLEPPILSRQSSSLHRNPWDDDPNRLGNIVPPCKMGGSVSYWWMYHKRRTCVEGADHPSRAHSNPIGLEQDVRAMLSCGEIDILTSESCRIPSEEWQRLTLNLRIYIKKMSRIVLSMDTRTISVLILLRRDANSSFVPHSRRNSTRVFFTRKQNRLVSRRLFVNSIHVHKLVCCGFYGRVSRQSLCFFHRTGPGYHRICIHSFRPGSRYSLQRGSVLNNLLLHAARSNMTTKSYIHSDSVSRPPTASNNSNITPCRCCNRILHVILENHVSSAPLYFLSFLFGSNRIESIQMKLAKFLFHHLPLVCLWEHSHLGCALRGGDRLSQGTHSSRASLKGRTPDSYHPDFFRYLTRCDVKGTPDLIPALLPYF